MLSGKKFTARMFIDATYEGDLMAAAGVPFHVGREAQDVYGETWNGVQTGRSPSWTSFWEARRADQILMLFPGIQRVACCHE